MATILITFGIIVVVILLMSVGVLLGRKPLAEGGCGEGRGAACAGCEKSGTNNRAPCPKEPAE